jgi:23S rRNA (guanine1835-N2)-methyltransferase
MPITSSAILGQHSFMFECGIGEFALERYPRRANEALQAWDAADKLILRKLEDHHESIGAVLVVNDTWGALSTALAHRRPSTLSDSYLAHAATIENLRRNHIDPAAVRLLTTFDPLPSRIETVAMKVPKSLALLEDQLHRIGHTCTRRPLSSPGQ